MKDLWGNLDISSKAPISADREISSRVGSTKWETFSIRALQILPKVNAVAYSGIKEPVRDQGSIYLVYIKKK